MLNIRFDYFQQNEIPNNRMQLRKSTSNNNKIILSSNTKNNNLLVEGFRVYF